MTSPSGALFKLYETTDLVERAYAETDGEVTDETEALEELQALAFDEALRRFASFVRYCELSRENVAAERHRLDVVETRIARAQAWAQGQLLALLDQAGKKKATAGTFKISTTIGRERVEVDDEVFDLKAHTTSQPFIAVVPLVPAVPASTRLDKKGALTHLKAGNKIPGLSIERGPTKLSVK